MIGALAHLNWLAVLAAGIAHFVLGGVWFTALFGRQYAAALGIADRPSTKPTPIFLVGPFVCGIVTVVTTAILLRWLGIARIQDGVALGALVGVGYMAAMTTNIAINPLFPHPLRYAIINAPMFIIGSVMSAAILTAMG